MFSVGIAIVIFFVCALRSIDEIEAEFILALCVLDMKASAIIVSPRDESTMLEQYYDDPPPL